MHASHRQAAVRRHWPFEEELCIITRPPSGRCSAAKLGAPLLFLLDPDQSRVAVREPCALWEEDDGVDDWHARVSEGGVLCDAEGVPTLADDGREEEEPAVDGREDPAVEGRELPPAFFFRSSCRALSICACGTCARWRCCCSCCRCWLWRPWRCGSGVPIVVRPIDGILGYDIDCGANKSRTSNKDILHILTSLHLRL